MKFKFFTMIICAVAMVTAPNVLVSCNKPDNSQIENPGEEPEIPEEPEEPVVVPEKPKVVWIDAEANFSRFRTKGDMRHFFGKIRDAGLNTVVVDVKSVQGDVLYPSDFMPRCEKLGSTTVNWNRDYLADMIEVAREFDLKVTVSTTFFPMGKPSTKTGPAYTDPQWEGKTCQVLTSDGIKDIRDCGEKVAAFLNPIFPEVQDYLLRMVEEIVTKYDVDSYALDYCRYCDEYSDFSEASKVAFEKWAGITVENFPDDIMRFENGKKVEGKYWSKWLAFRATVIHDFVAKVHDKIKSIKPEVKVEYWAGSWWHAIRGNGQNWASPDVDATKNPDCYAYTSWYTPEYQAAGFADHLDVFQLGAYLTRVYGPTDNESIEFAINRGKYLVGDACTMYGTIGLKANWDKETEQATELCLKTTEGIMIFDLVYVVKYDLWDEIKSGIDKAEAFLNEEANK